MRRSSGRGLIALLVAGLTAAACTTPSEDGSATLTVFAAASLTEPFAALERRFEDTHPGVDVLLNLDGSPTLAQQIIEGAPVDVFASADEATMRQVVSAGAVEGRPATFATNTLTIAVAPGNPHRIRGLADLAEPGLTVVVCAPRVPCGAATERVQRAAGVELTPASEEQNVKAVLAKVEAGVADAGLVYKTDVTARRRVEAVPFPESRQAVNTYPIATLAGAPRPGLAREFTELVLGEVGSRELSEAGFGTP
ncbi:molybdate transport system substrate-binding protein [Saccharomonospora amisosensis]|uniref:Molybdate transport system substrate-binding protein n=1 Tax=Saccharomonospora amisosensis TaxID=1128677 RepID=A0A7X5UMB0_9PSEU|nr:molybdate ABC transporter substrate-binding protein [Saccharomonospora amisosensis]NIJ10304.1 molybdate transport system substrate-binding protein [Saccharomonospora amisosensis]